MFPLVISHVAVVLPRHLVNGTIGWMSACGAGGSALLPFITGTIASNLGIESLQPLCVFCFFLVFVIHPTLFPFFFFFWKSYSDDDVFGYSLELCT